MPTALPRACAQLLPRTTFPPPYTAVRCALSGGPDSTALTALAVAAQLRVTAVHVHHGLRADADEDATRAARAAERLGAAFECVHVHLDDGPNLEARARAARRAAIGVDALTGHTADDQAETVLLALLRGAGARGLSAMTPGPTHPILGLRRSETRALCSTLGLAVADDPTNRDRRFRRNRLRHDVMALLDEVAERDVTPLLVRTAALLADDDAALDDLARDVDPTDAAALRAVPVAIGRRVVRQWLEVDGYPPDAATVARVLDVAAERARACQIGGGRRVERSASRLRLVADGRPASSVDSRMTQIDHRAEGR